MSFQPDAPNFLKKPWKFRGNQDERPSSAKKLHLVLVLREVREKGDMLSVGEKKNKQLLSRDMPLLVRNVKDGNKYWQKFEREYYLWKNGQVAALRRPIEIIDDEAYPSVTTSQRVEEAYTSEEHESDRASRCHSEDESEMMEDDNGLEDEAKKTGEGREYFEKVEEAHQEENKDSGKVEEEKIIYDYDAEDSADNSYIDEDSDDIESDSSSCSTLPSDIDDEEIEYLAKEVDKQMESSMTSLHSSRRDSIGSETTMSSLNSTGNSNTSMFFTQQSGLTAFWRSLWSDPLRAYYTIWVAKSQHTMKKFGGKGKREKLLSQMETISTSAAVLKLMRSPPKGCPSGFIGDLNNLNEKARRNLNHWCAVMSFDDNDESGDEENGIDMWNSHFTMINENSPCRVSKKVVPPLPLSTPSSLPTLSRSPRSLVISVPISEDGPSPSTRGKTKSNSLNRPQHLESTVDSLSDERPVLSSTPSANEQFRTPVLPRTARRQSMNRPSSVLARDLAMTPSPQSTRPHKRGRLSELRGQDQRTPNTGNKSVGRVETGSLKKTKNYPSFLSDDLALSPSLASESIREDGDLTSSTHSRRRSGRGTSRPSSSIPPPVFSTPSPVVSVRSRRSVSRASTNKEDAQNISPSVSPPLSSPSTRSSSRLSTASGKENSKGARKMEPLSSSTPTISPATGKRKSGRASLTSTPSINGRSSLKLLDNISVTPIGVSLEKKTPLPSTGRKRKAPIV